MKIDSQTKPPAQARRSSVHAVAQITAAELEALGAQDVPVVGRLGFVVESVAPGAVTIRVPFQAEFVRPGGTIAGPVMMALADFTVYGVVLSLVGPVTLAVTTNLTANFLRRPSAADLIAHGSILKLGRRLAVGEVSIYTGESEELVAHVTATYSIPPQSREEPGSPGHRAPERDSRP